MEGRYIFKFLLFTSTDAYSTPEVMRSEDMMNFLDFFNNFSPVVLYENYEDNIGECFLILGVNKGKDIPDKNLRQNIKLVTISVLIITESKISGKLYMSTVNEGFDR